MANELKYTIRASDQSKPALDSAKGGMKSTEDAAKKLGTALKAAFSVAAIIAVGKQIVKLSADTVKAYGIQEAAERKLAAAAAQNPLLDRQSVENLMDFAEGLQKITTVGDETTIAMAGMLASFGRSEDQIKSIIVAANDLSAATGISLDAAVRQLNQTFSGTSGTLGRLIPEVRDLTEEQLRNGEAVDIISAKFEGMGEAMAKGVEGTKQQFANAMGDLSEAVGSILGPLQARTLSTLQPIIEKATQWINDHAESILNFFVNFPDVIRATMNTAMQIIRRVFTADYLRTAVSTVWDYFKEHMRIVLTWAWDYLKAWGAFVWEPLKTGFEWAAYGIQTAWRNVADFIRNLINSTIMVGINAIVGGLEDVINAAARAAAFVSHPFDRDKRDELSSRMQVNFGTQELRIPDAVRDALEKPDPLNLQNMINALKDVGAGTLDSARQIWDNYKQLGAELSEPFSDLTQEFVKEMAEIVNRDLPEGMRMSAVEVYDAIVAASEELETAVFNGVAGAFSELDAGDIGGQVGARATQPDGGEGAGGMLAAIAGPLGILAEKLAEILSKVEAFAALMAPLSVILDGILDVLGPVMNEGLAPLVGILRILGQMVARMLLPILELMFPVIEALAKAFVWMYNSIFVPIHNRWRDLMNNIYNFFANLVNSVIRVINDAIDSINKILLPAHRISRVGYVGVRPQGHGHIGTIGFDDVVNAGHAGMGSDSSGEAARYTTGRNITINMEVYTDAIVGENGFRQFSLMVRDEIYAAEALGA